MSRVQLFFPGHNSVYFPLLTALLKMLQVSSNCADLSVEPSEGELEADTQEEHGTVLQDNPIKFNSCLNT